MRALLTGWDYSETERLLSERAEAIAKQREERLRTAAERDIAARIALRCVQALAVACGNTIAVLLVQQA